MIPDISANKSQNNFNVKQKEKPLDDLSIKSEFILPVVSQYDDNLGLAQEFYFDDNLLYIANYYGGLAIFNLSNISNPLFVSEYYNGTHASDIVVENNVAYLIDLEFGLEIINVSNPQQPKLITQFSELNYGYYYDIWVEGELAYLVSFEGLTILNLTEKNSPKVIGEINDMEMRSIFVEGEIVYVSYQMSNSTNYLMTINVSIPTNPQIMGLLKNEAWDIFEDLYVLNRIVYIPNRIFGLDIYNASDPESITHLGNFTSIVSTVKDVYVKENYAYLVGTEPDFTIINISNYSDIVKISSFNLTRKLTLGGYASNVIVQNNYAIILTRKGFEILNVTNKYTLTSISKYFYDGLSFDVCVKNGYAFLADGDNGLEIIDVNNKSTPKQKITLNYWDYTINTFIYEDYCLLVNEEEGFAIVDIQNPLQPVVVSNVTTGGSLYDIYAVNDLVYVTDQLYAQVLIYNITNPSNPIYVNGIHLPSASAIGVYVSGSYLFVGDYFTSWYVYYIGNLYFPVLLYQSSTGPLFKMVVINDVLYGIVGEKLVVYDISAIVYPELLGEYHHTGSIYIDIQVIGDYIFVADWIGGMEMLDVSSPNAIKSVAKCELVTSNCNGIFVDEGYIFLACYADGLIILEFPEDLLSGNNWEKFRWVLYGSLIGLAILTPTIVVIIRRKKLFKKE